MKDTSDYKIINIVKDHKRNFSDKDTLFSMLLRLKQSLEFNSNIEWNGLYGEISNEFRDCRPYYRTDGYTPDPIDRSTMGASDIFVFGSNTEGKHGGGAAKEALKYYGAIYGQARGLQGNSYAIVTKDLNIGDKSVDTAEIEKEIAALIQFALDNRDKKFWVTKLGCGLGGFAISDIAPLFANKLIPSNVVLPKEFTAPVYFQQYFYSPAKKKFFHVKSKDHVVVVTTGELNEIGEIKRLNIVDSLPVDIVSCEKSEYIMASEEALKALY